MNTETTSRKAPHTKVKYIQCISGGRTWLTLKMQQELQAEGWKIRGTGLLDKEGFYSLNEAIVHWEAITGLRANAPGCACCGQPHVFLFYVDGVYTGTGPASENDNIPHEREDDDDDDWARGC